MEGFEPNVFLPGKIKASLFIQDELNEELAILLKDAIDALIGAGSSEIFDILIFFSDRTNDMHFNQIKSIPCVRLSAVKDESASRRFMFFSLLQADILVVTDNPFSQVAGKLTNNETIYLETKKTILEKQTIKDPLDGIPFVSELSSIDEQVEWAEDNKIPALAYYSPAHKPLFDNFFSPSFNKFLSKDFELIVSMGEQICTVEFEKGGWNAQVKEKVLFANTVIQNMKNGFLLFSDVDIVFFENIKNQLIDELGKFDLIFQNDGASDLTLEHNLCSGFYFCRINNRIREFFSHMVENYDDSCSDQVNFNRFLANSKVRYKYLSKRFFNFSYGVRRSWEPNMKIPFPDHTLAIYHANYTLGNENKSILLREFTKWNEKITQIKDYIFSQKITGISVDEAIEIFNATYEIHNCKMLVVKTNINKNLWKVLNKNGYTFITSKYNIEHRTDHKYDQKWNVVVLGETLSCESLAFKQFLEENNDNIEDDVGGIFFFLG